MKKSAEQKLKKLAKDLEEALQILDGATEVFEEAQKELEEGRECKELRRVSFKSKFSSVIYIKKLSCLFFPSLVALVSPFGPEDVGVNRPLKRLTKNTLMILSCTVHRQWT